MNEINSSLQFQLIIFLEFQTKIKLVILHIIEIMFIMNQPTHIKYFFEWK